MTDALHAGQTLDPDEANTGLRLVEPQSPGVVSPPACCEILGGVDAAEAVESKVNDEVLSGVVRPQTECGIVDWCQGDVEVAPGAEEPTAVKNCWQKQVSEEIL